MTDKFKRELLKFIKDNPRVSFFDVVDHFKLPIGMIMDAVSELENEKRLKRVWAVNKYELMLL